MDKDKLIQRLLATFLGELDEHVRALNRDLLALEKKPGLHDRAELLGTLFRTVHSLKGASRSVQVGLIEAACHRLEEILTKVRDGQSPLTTELFQLLFAAADAFGQAGRLLREQKPLAGSSLEALLPTIAAAAAGSAGRQVESTAGPAPMKASAPPPSSGMVRISADKLDSLLAMSGELLVARRRMETLGNDTPALQELAAGAVRDWRIIEKALTRLPAEKNDTKGWPRGPNRQGQAGVLPRAAQLAVARARENLRKLSKDLDRLAAAYVGNCRALEQAASALDEQVRHIRMLPFAEACEGLQRTARDLAKAGNKEVYLAVNGGDIELDRTILERLRDPLLHLVRNAIDHGIESAEERISRGKPAHGRVTITAALRGANMEVVVEDDGCGIDLGSIRTELRKKNLAEPKDAKELLRMILLPGFSTSPLITELSGRGIGLDVVRSHVESLHGTVDLATTQGKGTRFVLTVPLTLTTIRALLVSAGGRTFAFPATNLQGLLRVGPQELRSVEGREMVLLGDAPVPIVSLAQVLGLSEGIPSGSGIRLPAVVLASAERRAAFVVEELLAEQEVVVKSLGPRLMRLRNVAGATILPTGKTALILNANDLIRNALGLAPVRILSEALKERAPEVRKRLLVVDDSLTTRGLEKSILEAAGYEVLAAADGIEAWQILQEKGADLIVADIEMPRMDGFALTEAIRGSRRFHDVPVVLVTAHESDTDKARGIEVGADAYLCKSGFDQRNLLETIAQLL